MSKATVIAEANIALTKHWGFNEHQLPLTDSISFNLSNCLTTTTAQLTDKQQHELTIINHQGNEKQIKPAESNRTAATFQLLDKIIEKYGNQQKFKIVSQNNFPIKAGIASSASGFTALVLACLSACGQDWQNLPQAELISLVAQSGSFSAVRSLVAPCSLLQTGTELELENIDTNLQLIDIIVLVNPNPKQHGSADGHTLAPTSPFNQARKSQTMKNTKQIKQALITNNFQTISQIAAQEAMMLHGVMQTSTPALHYLEPGSIAVINKIRELQAQGAAVTYSIDAGANIHVITLASEQSLISKSLESLNQLHGLITNQLGQGPRDTATHLY